MYRKNTCSRRVVKDERRAETYTTCFYTKHTCACILDIRASCYNFLVRHLNKAATESYGHTHVLKAYFKEFIFLDINLVLSSGSLQRSSTNTHTSYITEIHTSRHGSLPPIALFGELGRSTFLGIRSHSSYNKYVLPPVNLTNLHIQ